jgi:hypothetical protein
MKTPNTVVALLALALGAPAASASGPGPQQAAPSAQATADKPAVKPVSPSSVDAEAADEGKLENARGGDAAMSGEANLSGVVASNTAINVVTGSNLIDSSFNNASGLPMVIQNSGANVLIQNATVINLQLK